MPNTAAAFILIIIISNMLGTVAGALVVVWVSRWIMRPALKAEAAELAAMTKPRRAA